MCDKRNNGGMVGLKKNVKGQIGHTTKCQGHLCTFSLIMMVIFVILMNMTMEILEVIYNRISFYIVFLLIV